MATYFAVAVINGLAALYQNGYWKDYYLEQPFQFFASSSLAAFSIVQYVRNIKIPEESLLLVSASPIGYVLAGGAALGVPLINSILAGSHQAVEQAIEKGHLFLAYGGLIVNSILKVNRLDNYIAPLTFYTFVALRTVYQASFPIIDVPDDFDPVRNFIFSIAIQTGLIYFAH